MKKILIFLVVHLLLLFIFIEAYQKNKEYNAVVIQNNSLDASLGRILISKKELKGDLDKKTRYIDIIKAELDTIHRLAQGLQIDKKMLQAGLEEELTKRKIAEKNFRLAANTVKDFEKQIYGLNKDIEIYKEELTSIYAIAGEKDSYGLSLSKKIQLAKEGQAPYGRVTVVSKEYNFIIVSPFNKDSDLACGTAIEIYNEGTRIALGSIKTIKNNLVLVDNIISYSEERYVRQGDMVLYTRDKALKWDGV